ncbi:MAG TPA: hypothetical protein VM580_16030, partial [Labilithrix sp.]|nr:hypothetical protein [Labilithrix sp.]
VRPARVDGVLRRRELPVLLISTLALPLVLLDGRVQWWEAAVLMLAGVMTSRRVRLPTNPRRRLRRTSIAAPACTRKVEP